VGDDSGTSEPEDEMTEIKLPHVELPDVELPDVELPTMSEVRQGAADTIDRLLGRERMPIWPWVVLSVVLIGLIGSIAGVFAWNRRTAGMPPLDPEPIERDTV
jgi:hypothetical protein